MINFETYGKNIPYLKEGNDDVSRNWIRQIITEYWWND
jgi:hypothetical protein